MNKSTKDNFGKFIYSFQHKIKTVVKKLERSFIKFYRQNLSLLLNQTWLRRNAVQLPHHKPIYKVWFGFFV